MKMCSNILAGTRNPPWLCNECIPWDHENNFCHPLLVGVGVPQRTATVRLKGHWAMQVWYRLGRSQRLIRRTTAFPPPHRPQGLSTPRCAMCDPSEKAHFLWKLDRKNPLLILLWVNRLACWYNLETWTNLSARMIRILGRAETWDLLVMILIVHPCGVLKKISATKHQTVQGRRTSFLGREILVGSRRVLLSWRTMHVGQRRDPPWGQQTRALLPRVWPHPPSLSFPGRRLCLSRGGPTVAALRRTSDSRQKQWTRYGHLVQYDFYDQEGRAKGVGLLLTHPLCPPPLINLSPARLVRKYDYLDPPLPGHPIAHRVGHRVQLSWPLPSRALYDPQGQLSTVPPLSPHKHSVANKVGHRVQHSTPLPQLLGITH